MYSTFSLIAHSLHTAMSRIALGVVFLLLGAVASFAQSRGYLDVPHPAPIRDENVVREFIEPPSQTVGRNDKTTSQTHTRAADSLALVAFYNATGGAAWTNRTNWLTTQPISTWRGITVTNDRVVTISLSGNNVTGTLSGAINAIAGLSQLANLVLSNNKLTGAIPANISSFPLLFQISLWRNQLTGTIPASIGTLTALRFLFLDENSLTGAIPAEIGNLTNLERFDAPNNQLSGSLPPLGKLQKLQRLRLYNNQLSGSLPSDITTLPALAKVYLENNQFSGSIPAFSGTGTPNLDTLLLENNRFTGSIPASLGTLSKLAWVSLYLNQLSGEIPSSLGQLTALHTLRLDSNQLTGSIPAALGRLTRLRNLYLHRNRLTGSIPAELFSAPLEDCFLGNNQLSGSIPEQVGQLTEIRTLVLQNNQLSGTMPTSLGNLRKLRQLYLPNNQLSGRIPAELFSAPLEVCSISNNQLTGSIPEQIGNASTLTAVYFSNNALTGTIPQGLATLPRLEFLTCSSNQLSGGIPVALALRTTLRWLDVSSNRFSGDIPSGFANIDSLDDISFHNNNFTSLPNLSRLRKLTRLQVNNNRLSFESIEPNLSLPAFIYAPQDSVGEARDTSVVSGSALRIPMQVGGASNQYQWFKNGESLSGATQSILSINSATAQDSGRYSCRITNTRATALTLWTRPVQVRVSPAMTMGMTMTSVWGQNTSDEVAMGFSPNPVSELLTLDASAFVGQARLQLVNARGEVVISGMISGGERLQLDVRSLATGAYFVRLLGEKRSVMTQFTVIR